MKNKINNQGFTLIELLVVVLIIGILAGIALPQYKLAVGKAQYATLKNLTKSIAQAMQRYYLINGTILDDTTIQNLDIQIPLGTNCYVASEGIDARCDKEIFGKTMAYYHRYTTDLPKFCVAYSRDTTDMVNKLCQKETGKTANNAYCKNTYCTYLFY